MVKQREAEVAGVGLTRRENGLHRSRAVSDNTAFTFVSIKLLRWHSG